MSEQNQNRNNRSGGQGGGNRNNNRNRSGGQGGNRNGGNGGNRNNRGNRSGGGGGGGGGGNASQKRNELQPSRTRRPRQKPLTFWQKILKAVGLYKEPTPPEKKGRSGAPSKNAAKKSGRVPGGGRVSQGQGQGQGERKKQGPKAGANQRQRKKTPPPTKVESPRLYVGNLSYDASEYDLEELFKGVGAVRKVELVYNRHTHKSKGYGFINMANMEEAERAVEVLHDQPFMGRKMIVNGARSKGPNDKSPGGDSDAEPENDQSDQNDSSSEDPSEPKPATAAAVPVEEEVHSLAPDKD